MATAIDPEPMTRKQAAAFLGLSTYTLARWAMQGKGPRYSRTGDIRGRALYRSSDLIAWLESRSVDPSHNQR